MRISLQTKLITLVIALILFVTIMLTGIYAYQESKDIEENMGKTALRVATTVSLMPAVNNAFYLDEPSQVIQPLAENIRSMVGAEFIVIGNRESIRYSHPDEEKIGRKMVGGDNELALEEGQYYTSKAVGTLGPSLRGKAPILNDKGEVIGIVSVGFLLEDIQSTILKKILNISGVSLVILIFGITGGVLLAKHIRNDTLGLEPHQIASLYRERNAILFSIKEGIVAVDEKGIITMINHSAKKMLELQENCINEPIEKIFPNTKMYEDLQSGDIEQDVETTLRGRVVIINRTPIVENDKVVGVVASFRDKTEVQRMLDTIFEIRKYSEEMRAQTHEFTNRLYVLSGLLQLGHYQEAIKMIQTEYAQHENQNRILFDQIHDRTVQAILLGKISIASEKKIDFIIDDNSSLGVMPEHIKPTQIITIIGNLIDNAFEELADQKLGKVSFFITDMGNDVIIEVSDNGSGIDEDNIELIFEKGFSTKGKEDRGYGLNNIKNTVDSLHGTVEINNQKQGGAVFSIFLPKVLNKD